MKKILILFSIASFLSVSVSAQDFENEQDKFSYALGVIIAQNFKNQPLPELNTDLFGAGFAAAAGDKELKLDVNQASQFVNEYFQKFQEAEAEKSAEKFKGNKEAGEKFLTENKAKDGIMTTESGLQYMIITEGEGASPSATDKVTVHYEGTLTDGSVFDSSYKRNSPATFPLNGVIKGWTEGLQLMKTGAKYRFFIPQNLGYGARGAGGSIPPYSTLIFDVELISIEGK